MIMVKRKVLVNWMYVEPLLRSMSAATESQDLDTQPSVAAVPSPARFTRPLKSVKAEPSPETVTKKAKSAPPPPPKPLALAVKGSPAKAPWTPPMILTPPAKASMGVFTPTPPKQMAPPPVPTKKEVVTPTKSANMIARLRGVPIPKPSAKVEKPVLDNGANQLGVDGLVGQDLPTAPKNIQAVASRDVKLPPPASTSIEGTIIVEDDVSPASTVKDNDDTFQQDLLTAVEAEMATAKATATPPALDVTAKAAGGHPLDTPGEKEVIHPDDKRQMQLEAMLRTQLEKLDDVEFERRVKTAKQHVLMDKYIKEHLEIDEPYVFGESDAMEELINFEMYLEELHKNQVKIDPLVSSLKAASPVAKVPEPKPVPVVPAKAVPPQPVPAKAVAALPKKVAFTPLPPKAPALAKNGTPPKANCSSPTLDIQVSGNVPRLD